MDSISIGLLTSFTILLGLTSFFVFETKRGVRYGDATRRQFDYVVLKTSHNLKKSTHFFIAYIVRQMGHYSFHVILSVALEAIKKGERALRAIIHTNKIVARAAERESVSRSKLEEIALHKIASSLTEKEKETHKAKALKGR
jgi:hypothetical protein